jgi:hypothetical protein
MQDWQEGTAVSAAHDVHSDANTAQPHEGATAATSLQQPSAADQGVDRPRKKAFSHYLVRLADELETQAAAATAAASAQEQAPPGQTNAAQYERVSMRPVDELAEPAEMWAGADGNGFGADDEECMATPPDARPQHDLGF